MHVFVKIIIKIKFVIHFSEDFLVGRPYGGVGFIANKVKNITYKPSHVHSDRITGVQLVSGGEIIFTLFGVYLPYYNGSSEQI